MFRIVSTSLQKSKTLRYVSIRKWCTSVVSSHEEHNVQLEDSEHASHSKEEIDRMRDKSRLPDYIKTKYVKKQLPPLVQEYKYTLENLRSYYGTFGKDSGLNPGLCWPTPEELDLKLEYEALAYPPLQDMVERVRARKKAEVNARLKREREVEQNMAKLIKLSKEHDERVAKAQATADAQRLKKERALNEIREELGYHLDVRDPRFRDLIIKREEEQKKAAKELKKKTVKQAKVDYVNKLASQTYLLKEEKKVDDDD